MILDTTYYSKENKKRINELVGAPFSFLESLRLKGIGSKRMIIAEVSPNLRPYLNTVSDINYANIELRPNGIIVAINKGLKTFSWIIPYYQFYLYKTDRISIHAQGRFINFQNNITYRENKSFFVKLSRLKIAYDTKYPHVDSI